MRFWFQKSDRETGTAYVGAEHGGVTAFGALRVGGRTLARAAGRAAGALGMAAALRRLAKKTRAVERARRDARRRMDGATGPRKNPRRSTGMNRKSVRRPYKRKRR